MARFMITPPPRCQAAWWTRAASCRASPPSRSTARSTCR